MSEMLQCHLEKNTPLVNTVRFMIKDAMFDPEFLVTAVLEYLVNNQPKSKPEPDPDEEREKRDLS